MNGFGYQDIFADEYSRLTGNVDRQQMLSYILSKLRAHSIDKGIVLDAGCGSGDLCLLLCKQGYDMIGVDESFDMLTAAMEKAHDQNCDILFLGQPLCELDLYGTIDAAVSTLDKINHITDIEELQESLDRISLFMVPGGIFIFDVNTRYKHEQVLGNNCFVYDYEDLYCGWQNEYDPEEEITAIKLDFFEKTDSGYVRSEQEFYERYYSPEILQQLLTNAGFTILEIQDDYTENEPGETTQRVVYVVQKD